MSAFGLLALALAALGIYGVISYTVTQRTRELGVRMALGARPRDVMQLILRQAAILMLAGALVGLLGSLALGRLVASQLYDVTASDPLTLASVVALLGSVAILAAYLPARRATKVDPMIALRAE
jgi:ABC-type antimicrobial peptide transport system permease subunit